MSSPDQSQAGRQVAMGKGRAGVGQAVQAWKGQARRAGKWGSAGRVGAGRGKARQGVQSQLAVLRQAVQVGEHR